MTGRKGSDLIRSIRPLLVHWLDASTTSVVRPAARHVDSTRKVLIVRLDAIGDFILWLDAAREIRRLYPPDRYRVTLLGNRLWTPVAEELPFFDAVIPLDIRRFRNRSGYRLGILRELRRSGFDLVVQPTFSREFLTGDSVAGLCGAAERIGSSGDCSNQLPCLKRKSDRWYTRLVPASGSPLMELERNAEFLRGLGHSAYRSRVPDMTGLPFLREPPRLPEKYFVLFPGAGSPLRRWPVRRFAELAGRIHKETGWPGVVCGGPGEESIGDALAGSTDARLENRVGRTSITELFSIISRASLLVGNETSGIHIAAAVSVPSVCILGGGHYGRFLPYRPEVETCKPLPVPVRYPMGCFRCNWVCIHNPPPGDPSPCIMNIEVDVAWEAVRKCLPADPRPLR